jgi:hypothetical protein
MVDSFDPGALLAQWYELPRGPRVCLRLARIGDLAAIEALFAVVGLELDALEVARLVRNDPRQRIVICATALVDGAERVVGVGAIEISASQPYLLIVDERITDGLTELLAGALAGRAAALRSARAA